MRWIYPCTALARGPRTLADKLWRQPRERLERVIDDLRSQLELEEARRIREVTQSEERGKELLHTVKELKERLQQTEEARQYALMEKDKHESLLQEKLHELDEIDESYRLNMSALVGKEGEFSSTIKALESENRRLADALKQTVQNWSEESRKFHEKVGGMSKTTGRIALSDWVGCDESCGDMLH